MSYEAKIVRLNDDVEEEVTLRIGETDLTCFASVCPYVIEEGSSYWVELRLVVLDDYVVAEEAPGSGQSITRVGEGFSHIVKGVLQAGCLKSNGLVFEDEVLKRDFGYLDGKMISLVVNRIDAEFL